MDIEKVEREVEKILNSNQYWKTIILEEPSNTVDDFKNNTVRRLLRAYELYMTRSIYLNDYLIALRNYLLVFKTSIRLNTIDIPANNIYGINKDLETGKYFATYQIDNKPLDEYAETVFNLKSESYKDEHKDYNLCTDPMIYSLTGYSSFKSLEQKLAVYGALNTPNGYTTLISLPTGGGKSLVTQTLSYQRDGLTIVIVPTISLAIDQVRSAKSKIKRKNVDEEIFFYSSSENKNEIIDAISNRKAKMLFISPEALITNDSFKDCIEKANKTRYLKNIIIDEAHIVVDWGNSFRMDYQCLESWRNNLIINNPTLKTILLSATFEKSCVEILKKFFSNDDKWIEIRCDALRHEPRFVHLKTKYHNEKDKKVLELVCKLPHPLIIYVATPKDADYMKKYLSENGINNTFTFTGQTSSEDRKVLIKNWLDNKFEIMIATSAFGVGVDKSDVRTVLHLYIPSNPNSYYQELGRGGRDGLPCLSVMCTFENDIKIASGRISKKVLTVEKLRGRWESMYNNPSSKRKGNNIYIDTTVIPNYNIDKKEETIDDVPINETNRDWNIYVLLLLRRYDLIKINDVILNDGIYFFIIEILDGSIINHDENELETLQKIRRIEFDYYHESFKHICSALNNENKFCWSEMFFKTFNLVDEYCAGCMEHNKVNNEALFDFVLKKPVTIPQKEISSKQSKIFENSSEVMIICKENDNFIRYLFSNDISVLITDEKLSLINYYDNSKSIFTIGFNEFVELMKTKSYFYISGVVGIKYTGTCREIFQQYKLVKRYIQDKSDICLIHIVEENMYFNNMEKSFSDLINGPCYLIDD